MDLLQSLNFKHAYLYYDSLVAKILVFQKIYISISIGNQWQTALCITYLFFLSLSSPFSEWP